jgi:hypothetical protein
MLCLFSSCRLADLFTHFPVPPSILLWQIRCVTSSFIYLMTFNYLTLMLCLCNIGYCYMVYGWTTFHVFDWLRSFMWRLQTPQVDLNWYYCWHPTTCTNDCTFFNVSASAQHKLGCLELLVLVDPGSWNQIHEPGFTRTMSSRQPRFAEAKRRSLTCPCSQRGNDQQYILYLQYN